MVIINTVIIQTVKNNCHRKHNGVPGVWHEHIKEYGVPALYLKLLRHSEFLITQICQLAFCLIM
jgi:hypothetical protein